MQDIRKLTFLTIFSGLLLACQTHHHSMKRLLPVLMGVALLLLSSTEEWCADWKQCKKSYKNNDYETNIFDSGSTELKLFHLVVRRS